MALSYFGNKKRWENITREERYFCSALFWHVKNNSLENQFVECLNELTQSKKNDHVKYWEIGYEVCFYRDYLKAIHNRSTHDTGYSGKRTYDLCLFSENRIIIIEAKAHQGLDRDQFNYISDIDSGIDKNEIGLKQLLQKENITIDVILLLSSKYVDGSKKHPNSLIRESEIEDFKIITWKDINEKFIKNTNNSNADVYKIINRADSLYKD